MTGKAPPWRLLKHWLLLHRAGIQSVAADPILPMGLGFGYSAYKIFDKRQKRNPDGPYFGNSPIWGSILMALLGMMLGLLVSSPKSFLFSSALCQPTHLAIQWPSLAHPGNPIFAGIYGPPVLRWVCSICLRRLACCMLVPSELAESRKFLLLQVGFLAVRFLPFPSFIQPQSFAVGMIPAMCGVMAICFK